MPVNETTAGRGYQLPHPSNTLPYDVARLRAALAAVDADVVAALASLAAKAATVHSHGIEQVSGLSAALDGKAAAIHSHTLASLSGVSIGGATSGNFLRYNGTQWIAGTIGIGDVTNLGANLASLQAAIDDYDEGTF